MSSLTATISLETDREAERRREASALRREAEMWNRRLKELAAEAERTAAAYGAERIRVDIRAGDVPSGDDLAALRRSVERLKRLHGRHRHDLDATIVDVRREVLRASLGGLSTSRHALTAHEALASPKPRTSGAEERIELVERVLDRLEPGVSSDALEHAEQLAEELVRADSERDVDVLGWRLRELVTRANEAARRRQAELHEVAELRARLPDTPGDDEATRLCAALERIEEGKEPLSDDLRESVHRWAGSREPRPVIDVLADALTSQGYQVEEGFATLACERGHAFFRRSEWGDRAVQLRLDRAAGRLSFDMVAVTDAGLAARDAAEDAEVEAGWCAEVDRLAEAVRSRGAELAIDAQQAAGRRRLPIVRAAEPALPQRSDQAATNRRRRTQERVRDVRRRG